MKKYFLILLFVSALVNAQIYSSVPGLKITNDPVKANDTTEVELLGRVITGANEGKVYSLPYSKLAIPRNTSDLVNDGEDGNSPYVSRLEFDYISPNYFTGTETERIQKAIDSTKTSITKRVVIGYDDVGDDRLWVIDSAITVPSDVVIVLEDVKIKMSDSMRDNILRSENVGEGITDPETNPLQNITIIGIGDAFVEGADNPRATGDRGKTLTLSNPSNLSSLSYGTDSQIPEEKQTGDWRNVGLLFGYVENLTIKNIKVKDPHAYAISLERCSNFIIEDIVIDNKEKRVYEGVDQYVKNADGIDILYSHHGYINNISGVTGDDGVAFTNLKDLPSSVGAGDLNSNIVTGYGYTDEDAIREISCNNIRISTIRNTIRLLNTGGSEIYDVSLSNILDPEERGETHVATIGGLLLTGDSSPSYGTTSPLGSLRNITVTNVVSNNNRYFIRMLGNISDSSFSNMVKNGQDSVIFFGANATGMDNVAFSNVADNFNNITYLSGAFNGSTTATYTGTLRDSSGDVNNYKNGALGVLKIANGVASNDAATVGQLPNIITTVTDGSTSIANSNAVYDFFRIYNVSTETNLDNYVANGTFLTPSSGLTNLPSGWAQGRHIMHVGGQGSAVLSSQIIISPSTGRIAYRGLVGGGTPFTSWQVVPLQSEVDAKVANDMTASTTVAPSKTAVNNALALKANIASPALTGTPTAPTATAGTSTTQIATTAFVTNGLSGKANINSPAFTGTPTAPNPSAADYSTNIATTKFATDIASFYGTQLETESGATFTITPSRKKVVLVCTGTTITVDFPPVLGNEGVEIVIINKGSGDATLASDAGGNDFWDAGSSGSGAVVPTNSTATFINDGTHYSKK